MDIKISNKDIVLNSNCSPEMVTDFQEIIQRVNICCNVPKGSFIYNRNLGSEIRLVDFSKKDAIKKSQMLLNEAIIGIAGASIRISDIIKEEDCTIVKVQLTYFKNTAETEVII